MKVLVSRCDPFQKIFRSVAGDPLQQGQTAFGKKVRTKKVGSRREKQVKLEIR